MKSIGGFLLVVGVVVLGLGLARHASAFMLKGTNHASIYLGVAGLVILVLAAGVSLVGRAD